MKTYRQALIFKTALQNWNNVQKGTSKTTSFNLNLIKNTNTLVFEYILK